MKQPPPCLALIIGVLCVRMVRGDSPPPQLNDQPVTTALYDSVRRRYERGEYAALSDLAKTHSRAAIPLLLHYITPQDEPDDPVALAAGKALVELRAEPALKQMILDYSREATGAADRKRSQVFDALSFMKSKAAIRVLGSLLDDDTVQDRPSLQTGRNPGVAIFALIRQAIPGSPRPEEQFTGLTAEDIVTWQAWWKTHAKDFEDDLPLPPGSPAAAR